MVQGKVSSVTTRSQHCAISTGGSMHPWGTPGSVGLGDRLAPTRNWAEPGFSQSHFLPGYDCMHVFPCQSQAWKSLHLDWYPLYEIPTDQITLERKTLRERENRTDYKSMCCVWKKLGYRAQVVLCTKFSEMERWRGHYPFLKLNENAAFI